MTMAPVAPARTDALAPAAPARRRRLGLALRRQLPAWLFLAPALLLFAVFKFVPWSGLCR